MKKQSLLEAALYVAGRPLHLSELSKIIKDKDTQKVRALIEDLIEDYKSRDTALEVVELPQDRFVLQLKPSYSPKVTRYAPSGFLSAGALKVLSLIGLRQPIPQSQVIEQRGSHAYQYVKELLDKEFISKDPYKRTFMLRTTETFASYFGFPTDLSHLKLQLQKLLQKHGYLRSKETGEYQPIQTTLGNETS